MAIWVDGNRVEDEDGLSDAVGTDGTVHVLQALSGG